MRRIVGPITAMTLGVAALLAGGTSAFAQTAAPPTPQPTPPQAVGAGPQTVAPAVAPAGPPSRIGNVWGGNDHEIAPGTVIGNEKAAGVALPPAQSQQQNAEVEREAAKLLHQTPPTAGTSR